ncbi:zinc finger BED domain-containing protein 4-like, partial [Aphis craccivora]
TTDISHTSTVSLNTTSTLSNAHNINSYHSQKSKNSNTYTSITQYLSRPVIAFKRKLLDRKVLRMILKELVLKDTVTAHYIDKECDLKSYFLSCFKYSESHTSINLKNELLRVVQEWGLENRITACTTDNSLNITNAIQLCNWRTYLKISLISTLAEINFEVVLTGEDWHIISRSCEILKRFNEITVEISAEKTVSMSKSVVFSRALKKFCDDIKVKNLIQSTNPTATATVEVDKYLQEGLLARSENPLKWWKENKNVYPRLFSVMRKRLGIMITSVPCERIFSKS